MALGSGRGGDCGAAVPAARAGGTPAPQREIRLLILPTGRVGGRVTSRPFRALGGNSALTPLLHRPGTLCRNIRTAGPLRRYRIQRTDAILRPAAGWPSKWSSKN